MNETKPSPKILKSTFLWIVVLFCSANFLWGFIRPLQTVPHTSQPNLELSKAALRFKIDELKAGKKPDVLIIGSSLPMCAFFYTERPPFFDLHEGDRIRDLHLNLLQAYPKAGYFTAKLKEVSGQDLSVFNFAGAACMVSDTKLVMDRCLAAQKRPRVIIYGVGLRDFVDNVNPPPGETPYYKALCNTQFLLANLKQVYALHSFNDLAICALFKLYDLRNEFRLTAEHIACKALHHPSSLEIAFVLGDLNRQIKTKAANDAAAKASVLLNKTVIDKNAASRPVQNNGNHANSCDATVSAAVQTTNTASTNGSSAVQSTNAPSTPGSAPAQSTNAPSTAGSATAQRTNAPSTAGSVPVQSTNATSAAGSAPAPTNVTANATGGTSARANIAVSSANSQSAKQQATNPTATVTPSNSAPLSALDYKQRYTPANYKRMNAEMHELKNLIATCKQKGIRLVIVNMPVSAGHKTLSPPGLREKYLAALRSVAPAADLFLDYENDQLPDSYFFDTVHLNGTGSVKFVDDLSRRLQTSRILVDPNSMQAAFLSDTL